MQFFQIAAISGLALLAVPQGAVAPAIPALVTAISGGVISALGDLTGVAIASNGKKQRRHVEHPHTPKRAVQLAAHVDHQQAWAHCLHTFSAPDTMITFDFTVPGTITTSGHSAECMALAGILRGNTADGNTIIFENVSDEDFQEIQDAVLQHPSLRHTTN